MTTKAALGEIFTPPNNLRRKIGGKLGPANDAMIAKAEAALEDLSSNFDEWIVDELGKLEAAHKNVQKEGLDGDAGLRLFSVAHDLKGLGTTYGYQLVSALADSLCKITMEKEVRSKVPADLITAHVQSIRAVITGHIKTADHKVGLTLVRELSTRVEEFLAGTQG